jgi:HEPN domain-containing protein
MKAKVLMNGKIQYWIDISDYDLETADAMLETKRYLYVGFMCHQVIEKIFKALYVKNRETIPPYTHNLKTLFDEGGFEDILSDEWLIFISEITPLNINARYPRYKEELLRILTPKKCKEVLHKTKELQKWIKSKLST